MKVAFDVSQAVYGTGVSDYILNLTSCLPSQSMVYFGSSFRRQKDLKRLFPLSKTLPFPPRFLHHLWNRLHVINLENLIGKFDVLHSSDWTQPPTRAKKVTTIHDLSAFLYPKELDPRLVRVQTARMNWVVKECDAVICVSYNTSADFQRLFNFPSSKIYTIPEALPSRYLLTPHPSLYSDYLVAIGARQPRKNVDRLISAFLNFGHKFSLPEKLIIIGESSRKAINDSVIYTGYVLDQLLVDILAGATAFVYPSLYEGFGLPILGAFYHKVPVACSDIAVFRETAGPAAAYFNPGDEESIACSIASAIKNKSKLIKFGMEQLKKFSWQIAADQTVKVYKSLL